MIFNSYVFIFSFLPLSLAGYFLMGIFSRRLAMSWLAGASIVFYSYWSLTYLYLLIISIFLNYTVGFLIIRWRETRKKASVHIAILGVFCNISVLLYFKYFNFFIENLSFMIGALNPGWEIILPLGISFYTFTQIAFLVDACKGKVKDKGIIEYILFVTYFPHLIAGPILHHAEMMGQFLKKECVTLKWNNISLGLSIFILGLSKKVLIADNLAPYADAVFAFKGSVPTIEAWSGALSYTLQIYFDFSGYSDMAIGLSKLFNINLPLNFYSPYKASSIIEFWRRWHISLSRFLRDYLYIPLGGSRKGSLRQYANLGITMLLGGLWHGASWNFVIWGALHAIYLFANHAFLKLRSSFSIPRLFGSRQLSCGLTFVIVVVAWVFFRASDVSSAYNILKGMIIYNRVGFISGISDQFYFVFSRIAVSLWIVWLLPNSQQIFHLPVPSKLQQKVQKPLRGFYKQLLWHRDIKNAIFYSLLLVLSLSLFLRTSHFLYFQF